MLTSLPRTPAQKSGTWFKLYPARYELNCLSRSLSYSSLSMEARRRLAAYPELCPLCEEDVFPQNPSVELQQLFNLYCRQPSAINAGPICKKIKSDMRSPQILESAVKLGWPTTIDFQSLPQRISSHWTQIRALFTSPSLLKESPAWSFFISRFNDGEHGVAKFYKLSEWAKFNLMYHTAHGG